MAVAGTGCNPWLNLKPDNKQISDDYWKSKEEVDAVVQSMYSGLRDCEEKFFLWGELRGDMLGLNTASQDLKDVRALNILPSKTVYTDWSAAYKVIGRANAVLDYAEGVMDEDVTFARQLLNSYLGEAKFMRALTYFYLVRTFGDIPYVTKAFVSDNGGSDQFKIAKTDKDKVLEGIINDLMGTPTSGSSSDTYVDINGITRNTNGAIHYCKPGYGSSELNKGRATRWVAYTLLADVALWMENYNLVLDAAYKVIENNGTYGLVSQENWYDMFAIGNSPEAIFELQYRTPKSQDYVKNSFLESNFKNSVDKYKASDIAIELFKQSVEEDIRGTGASFLADATIWKYAGTDISSDKNTNNRTIFDNNWIFYRYSEVLLMYLEAATMLNSDFSASNQEYANLWNATITRIRRRAGLNLDTEFPVPGSQQEALMTIVNERSREFFVEGKRWFDIHRVAKKNNYANRDYLLEVLLAEVSAKERPVFLAKLQDENGYYLPIPKRDIESSGRKANGDFVLEQNPYYVGLE